MTHDTENYDGTPLSEEAIAAHQEAIDHIDDLLDGYGSITRQRELTRERAHLVAELAAGRYLPLPDDDPG